VSKSFASSAALSLALLAGCVSPNLGGGKGAPAPAVAAPAPAPSPTAAPSPAYPQARPLDESKPVKLRADRLRYNDKLKETLFKGHVVATQDTATLSADELRSSDQGQSARVSGSVKITDSQRRVSLEASEGDYSGALSEANLRGGVKVVSVDPYAVPVTVTGRSAWYQSVSRLARVEGGVRVERGRLSATAESAELDAPAETVELKGGVEAGFGANRVKSSSARLDGKRKSAAFEGGVEARLVPAEVRESAAHPEKP
jgi:lipopolysaccharide transport protein LptA